MSGAQLALTTPPPSPFHRGRGGIAAAYARSLLASLGLPPARTLAIAEEHPALTWVRSGLMALTGERNGAPMMCPVPLASCADGALAALASLAPAGAFAGLRGSFLLSARAALAGLSRAGAVSAGGSCRLLQAADGWIALNLARADDWALIPAWLEAPKLFGWANIRKAVTEKSTPELVERGRLLGLAVAADQAPSPQPHWYSVAPSSPRPFDFAQDKLRPGSSVERALFPLDPGLRRDDPIQNPHRLSSPSPLVGEGEPRSGKRPAMDGRAGLRAEHGQRSAEGGEGGKPLVIDLSSLWAGPLCSHLLQLLGARVIKVESHNRPDGARLGPAAFFDLLNANKQSVALELDKPRGREQLRLLLSKADIVIEASRPRALRQFGIHAEEILSQNPGLTWISITGYGRGEAEQNWVAYGDDAGVAAGLSQLMYQASGHRVFVGDAIADPLTGIHAALAAWASYMSGGGRLISLALHDVVQHCAQFDLPGSVAALRERQSEWAALVETEPARPQARRAK